MYGDKALTCADCSQGFIFTASEQEFYATRGFTEPRRCPSCRGRQNRFRCRSRCRPRGPREMFTATCSNCGKEASVPFRPTSGKPVYCSDCFALRRA